MWQFILELFLGMIISSVLYYKRFFIGVGRYILATLFIYAMCEIFMRHFGLVVPVFLFTFLIISEQSPHDGAVVKTSGAKV